MVNGFVGRLQARLSELKQKVAEYEIALKVGEAEARVERDGTFKGAFAEKAPMRRRPKAPKRHVAPGLLRDFVRDHVNVDKAPADEARRLRPLAKKVGIKTTFGSMAQAIYVQRRVVRATQPDLDTPVYEYVAKHGPLPYNSIGDWFAAQYPDVADAQPRKAVSILTGLKAKAKMRLTSDGWWEAI